jgi:starch synthase
MAQSRRILFVAGEVTPFADTSSLASLARFLPVQLQEAGDYEARVMMPCYSSIDERKHNLHEVIRLSGTDVSVGDGTETLTVKVASIPDVRLQVYFIDHERYFEPEEDTDASYLEQALFFNRSVLETIRKLRWGPDLVHAFGPISGLVPLLMSTDYAEDDHLGTTKTVFTPGMNGSGTTITDEVAAGLDLSLNGADTPSLSETARSYADSSVYPPSRAPTNGAEQFTSDEEQRGGQLSSLYDQMLSEVPA